MGSLTTSLNIFKNHKCLIDNTIFDELEYIKRTFNIPIISMYFKDFTKKRKTKNLRKNLNS